MDSTFVGKCVTKLASGQNLTDKIRLLRLYGKYLNQDEYSNVTAHIRLALDV